MATDAPVLAFAIEAIDFAAVIVTLFLAAATEVSDIAAVNVVIAPVAAILVPRDVDTPAWHVPPEATAEFQDLSKEVT